MEINKSCKLLLENVYLYDISACHYTILERLGHDMSLIEKDDKKKRNIQIGLMMKENPRLIGVLRSITNSTIDQYILRNNIKEEDLILRQYDGIIIKKKLTETTLHIPIEFKYIFTHMLISSDRQKYIALGRFEGIDNTVFIKGVSNRYEKMDEILGSLIKRVSNSIANKSGIFGVLQSIKTQILTSEDPLLYCIPTNKDKFNIFLKRYGETQISKGVTKLLDTSDIDKQKYYDFYVRPFSESVCIEFM